MKRVLRISVFACLLASFVLLCSCAPKSVLAAYKKMVKNEYSVDIEYNKRDASKYEAIVSIFAEKEYTSGNYDIVTAMLFSNTEAAKLAYEQQQNSIKQQKKAAEAIGTKLNVDTVCKRSGKWVVYGTEKAVDAFLK